MMNLLVFAFGAVINLSFCCRRNKRGKVFKYFAQLAFVSMALLLALIYLKQLAPVDYSAGVQCYGYEFVVRAYFYCGCASLLGMLLSVLSAPAGRAEEIRDEILQQHLKQLDDIAQQSKNEALQNEVRQQQQKQIQNLNQDLSVFESRKFNYF